MYWTLRPLTQCNACKQKAKFYPPRQSLSKRTQNRRQHARLGVLIIKFGKNMNQNTLAYWKPRAAVHDFCWQTNTCHGVRSMMQRPADISVARWMCTFFQRERFCFASLSYDTFSPGLLTLRSSKNCCQAVALFGKSCVSLYLTPGMESVGKYMAQSPCHGLSGSHILLHSAASRQPLLEELCEDLSRSTADF